MDPDPACSPPAAAAAEAPGLVKVPDSLNRRGVGGEFPAPDKEFERCGPPVDESNALRLSFVGLVDVDVMASPAEALR